MFTSAEIASALAAEGGDVVRTAARLQNLATEEVNASGLFWSPETRKWQIPYILNLPSTPPSSGFLSFDNGNPTMHEVDTEVQKIAHGYQLEWSVKGLNQDTLAPYIVEYKDLQSNTAGLPEGNTRIDIYAIRTDLGTPAKKTLQQAFGSP